MTEKIDFLNYFNEANHPLDKKTMLEILQTIFDEDEEIIWGFVDSYTHLIREMSLWRDILSCGNHSRREVLIDSLSEEQLARFSRIVFALKKGLETDEFMELAYAAFQLGSPIEASIEKATEFIEIVKQQETADLEFMALDLIQTGKDLQILGGLFFCYKDKNFNEDSVNKLAQMSAPDLKRIIDVSRLRIYGQK